MYLHNKLLSYNIFIIFRDLTMKKLFFVFSLILFLPIKSLAIKVSDLYQVELPVSAQTVDARSEAAKEGFVQVLRKITGDLQIDQNPLVKPSIQRADYFIQEFSYLPQTTDSSQYEIKITYNAFDVQRMLRKIQVPYWGENRPLILVWLAVIKDKNVNIIGNEEPGDILHTLKSKSKKIGLPLIFPMMDVADVNKISSDQILEMEIRPLKEAGKRYAPDGLLIGKIEATDEGYVSRFELVLGSYAWDFEFTDQNTDHLIEMLLQNVSQVLSKHYVVRTAIVNDIWLKLQIHNVAERQDLSELLHYLSRLSTVQQVRLSQISGDVVNLAVLVRGSVELFQKNATIDQKIKAQSIENNSDKLIYTWLR